MSYNFIKILLIQIGFFLLTEFTIKKQTCG